MTITGVAGALGSGYLTDKLRHYKLLLIVCYMGTLGSILGFVLVIRFGNKVSVGVLSGLLGVFITAILPLSLQGKKL